MRNGTLTVKKLLDFIHNSKYTIKLIKQLLSNFTTIKIAEYYENTFKVKIYKQDKDMKSIGFVFGLVEDIVNKNYLFNKYLKFQKDSCNITEYSICQTSLEQIFNKFAFESGVEESQSNNNNVGTQNIQQDDEELLIASKAAYKMTKPEITISQDFVNVNYIIFYILNLNFIFFLIF